MGDLDDKNAAQSTKIIGADSNATETTPVRSKPWGDMGVSDHIESAQDDTITVTAGTPIKLQIGVDPLPNRKVLFFIPDGKVIYGFSSGVGNQNIPVYKNQPVRIKVTEGQIVWVDALAGTVDIFIVEGAG